MSPRTAKAAPLPAANDEAWPFFDEDEIAAAMDVLRSGRVNQWTGDRIRAFEDTLADRIGMPHAIALANGTLALELALRAYGIGPGDEVVVTARSFVASASCVAMVGATPVFADVDPQSQNMSAATIAPVLTPRTRAVIPVHLAGWPADMDSIMAVAADNNLIVVEDCAQSLGAEIDGRPAGSFGHAAAFSFCQDKIVTTGGEGGMLLLKDDEAWTRAWSFKDHGKRREPVNAQNDGPGFRWLHDSIGTNWRMTEMQAAIGLAQLAKLDAWLHRRRANAATWREALSASPALQIPTPPDSIRHAFYKLYAFLVPERLKAGATRDKVLAELQANGVRAFSGSCPEIYREKAFADMRVEPLPSARALGETSLMFEVHPTLDPARLRATASKAREIVSKFERVK